MFKCMFKCYTILSTENICRKPKMNMKLDTCFVVLVANEMPEPLKQGLITNTFTYSLHLETPLWCRLMRLSFVLYFPEYKFSSP